jgi:hypothetical protein
VSAVELEFLQAGLTAGVALITLVLTWFVTTRVTTTWNLRQKQRELALSSADQFYALYGEFFAIWKLWEQHLRSAADLPAPGAAETRQELLERTLDALGSFRQGYQTLRERIRNGRPMGWNWDSEPEYAAFKFLASRVSQTFLSWAPAKIPTAAEHYRNFRKVTANYWEPRWVETAMAQGCDTTVWRPASEPR